MKKLALIICLLNSGIVLASAAQPTAAAASNSKLATESSFEDLEKQMNSYYQALTIEVNKSPLNIEVLEK